MKPLFPDIFVNGEQIPSAVIAAEVQNHSAPEGKPGLAWRKAAHALIVRHLLLKAAAASGLTTDPLDLGEERLEDEDESLIRTYLDAKIDPDPVSVQDVENLFRQRAGSMPDTISPDDKRTQLRYMLEKAAWAKAANDLVGKLVAEADITGFDMQKAT